MFSKKKRVTKELFQAIMKNGRTASGSLFLYRYIPQGNPQFAIVAPKTVSKRAVSRNSLRRKGYTALKAYILPSHAGLFFYKKGSTSASFSEIKADIGQIIGKFLTK